MTNDELRDFSMLGLFLMELENQVQVLSTGLLKLEKNQQTQSDLEALMRAAHSLKGGARIIQSDPIAKLAHAMEDYFVALINHKITTSEQHIDQLLNGVDLIKKLSTSPEADFYQIITEFEKTFDELAGEYRNFTTGAPAAPAVHPPPPPSTTVVPAQPPTTETTAPAEPIPSAIPKTAAIPKTVQGSPPQRPHTAETTVKNNPEKSNFIKVAIPQMDHLMGLAGESVVHVKKLLDIENRINQIKKSAEHLVDATPRTDDEAAAEQNNRYHELNWELNSLNTEFSDLVQKIEGFSSDLYHEVISCKIMPFGDLSKVFPRMVRDIAKKLGKQVNFELSGEKTGLDRDILELLEAPIDHLLRNALDHGLELPEERIAAGKSPLGTIKLSAFHWAGMFNISITDDGRGIDLEKLKEHIINRDLATAEMLKNMQPKELLDFLFLPGFSTKDTVSEISGRGVGLDVVMSMVQEVKGSINIETELGKYTTFNLQLPITLSVISAMIVEVGNELYAFPSTRIDRLLLLPADQIKTMEAHQYITIDDTNIDIVDAGAILDYPATPLNQQQVALLIISDHTGKHALLVNRFVRESKIVVRPLCERLGKIFCINAGALLEDGTSLLIVDVDDILRAIELHIKNNSLRRLTMQNESEQMVKRKRVLVIDDSITVRELEKQILEAHGYQVETAINGVDGWNAARTSHFDIIITDIDMPRMNGIELVEKLKSHQTLKTIPVMIVSYKDREEDRLKGVEAGADYYLTKSSFHDNTMIEAVYQLIGEAGQ